MDGMSIEMIILEIICGIVVPIIVVLLQQYIAKRDIKNKNKELGYWLMKWKTDYGFVDSIFLLYIRLAIVFVFIYIVKGVFKILNVWQNCFVLYGILYFIIGTIIVCFTCMNAKTKVEMWTDRKQKWKLVILLYLIYSIPLFYETSAIIIALFTVLLFGWACCVVECCDVAYIIDKSYADIYVKNSEAIKYIEAGNIKKQGEWIIVNKCVDEMIQEIRIRESDIARIDYYGEPIIRVNKRKLSDLFKR